MDKLHKRVDLYLSAWHRGQVLLNLFWGCCLLLFQFLVNTVAFKCLWLPNIFSPVSSQNPSSSLVFLCPYSLAPRHTCNYRLLAALRYHRANCFFQQPPTRYPNYATVSISTSSQKTETTPSGSSQTSENVASHFQCFLFNPKEGAGNRAGSTWLSCPVSESGRGKGKKMPQNFLFVDFFTLST